MELNFEPLCFGIIYRRMFHMVHVIFCLQAKLHGLHSTLYLPASVMLTSMSAPKYNTVAYLLCPPTQPAFTTIIYTTTVARLYVQWSSIWSHLNAEDLYFVKLIPFPVLALIATDFAWYFLFFSRRAEILSRIELKHRLCLICRVKAIFLHG